MMRQLYSGRGISFEAQTDKAHLLLRDGLEKTVVVHAHPESTYCDPENLLDGCQIYELDQ